MRKVFVMKKRLAIVGYGGQGAWHATWAQKSDVIELAGIFDIAEKRMQAARDNGIHTYSSREELLADKSVDIVLCATPNDVHKEIVIDALNAKKNVVCEKPVALTVKEASDMLKKQKETGANVQIGQVIRFWDEYVVLKDIIDSGKYGKVVNANFRRLSPRPTWGWNNWLLDDKLSGGAGQDLHVHDVDYVISLFGKPEAFYTVRSNGGEKNSYVNTLMKYDDKVVSVEGTWDLPGSHPFEASFRVVFEKGVVENAGGRFAAYTDEGANDIVIEKKKLAGDGYSGGNISDLGGYYNELVYFTTQAKAGAKIENATLADGAESLEFVLGELVF